ncbi:MAG: NAD(P)H-quinone oxidoreductase [Blastocatellia bacterium]|nr:NAD(P)H-quinone oxidoreductase [Blastocatellia bacterium]
MKAIVQDGEKLLLGESDTPKFGKDEIVVKTAATAINRADLLQKRGLYPPPAGASTILGLEAAGVVEQVGEEVVGWKIGDRVCALLAGGGYAEYFVTPAELAMPIPEHFSFEEAAAIPEAFLTVQLSLVKLGGLTSNQTVLIHAGASGIGTAAIQMVREMGSTAVVTVGSERKQLFCLSLGAELTINYREEDFEKKIAEFTEGKGVNIILDPVGAPYWQQNINSLAMDGRLVLIATMGGAKLEAVDLRKILSRRLQVIGTTLRARSREEKSLLTREFIDFALECFNDGRLVPVIDNVWNWRDVEEAHRYMEQNSNIGKLVLKVD